MSLLTRFCYPDDPQARGGRFYNPPPMPRWLWITLISLATALYILQLAIFSKGCLRMDSLSYYHAWETIKGIHTDPMRTPVYAIIVGVLYEILGKDGSLTIIPALNWGFYLMSLRMLWDINQQLRVKQFINILSLLTLMLIPGFWVLVNFSMAEIMAMMWVVMLLWQMQRYIIMPSDRLLYIQGGVISIAILTKPLLIFLVILYPIAWLIVRHRRKGSFSAVIKATLVPVVICAGYLYCMYHTHTFAMFTAANTYNSYISLRYASLITPQDITDPGLRERFTPLYDSIPGGRVPGGPYWQEVTAAFSWPELNEICQDVLRNHRSEYNRAIFHRFVESLHCSQFYSAKEDDGFCPDHDKHYGSWDGISNNLTGGYIYPFYTYTQLPLYVGLIITLAYIVLWCRRWLNTGRLPLFAALIAAVYLSAYFIAIYGAPDLWGRILTPVSPLLVVMAALIISATTGYIRQRYHKSSMNK